MDFYEVLGVERSASTVEIRRAYKRKALEFHPDKVAEPERAEAEIHFKTICEAYETLGDGPKRAEYDAGARNNWQDAFGAPEFDEAADFFASAGTDPYEPGGAYADAYNAAYGSAYTTQEPHSSYERSRATPKRRPGRTDDAEVELEVDLEHVYRGRLFKLGASRKVLCTHCDGIGARPHAPYRECKVCSGTGERSYLRNILPGVAVPSSAVCTKCQGQGRVYRKKDCCRWCSRGLVEERSIIEVYIPKGAPNGYEVRLEGKADQALGMETGDIVIHVQVSEDSRFRREGLDLYTRAPIALREALTGLARPLVIHLDGRHLRPTIPRGTIIYPGQILKIPGEGLVLDGDLEAGNMYVQLDLVFPRPEELSEDALAELSTLLPVLPPEVSGVDGRINDVEAELVEENALPSYSTPETSFTEDKPGCAQM